MTELMTMPMHGWVLYPVIRGLLQLTMSEGGSLVGNHKNGPHIRDDALELLRLWFASLKPTGGSFAGALKPNGTDPDPTGDADLANVITKEQRDACPGYWWSEQMKYYWLAFSDTPRFDYKSGYLSTEGNVLRGFNLGKQA